MITTPHSEIALDFPIIGLTLRARGFLMVDEGSCEREEAIDRCNRDKDAIVLDSDRLCRLVTQHAQFLEELREFRLHTNARYFGKDNRPYRFVYQQQRWQYFDNPVRFFGPKDLVLMLVLKN